MASKRVRIGGGGSPSVKKTKDKSGEVSVCVKCNKNVEEDSIKCESCLQWEHRDCAGISKEEYEVLGDLSNNIMFFCSICRLKFFNEIEENQKSVGERVKQLEKELKSLNTKISQLSSQTMASTLEAYSTVSQNDKPTTVQAESRPIQGLLPPKPPPSITDRKYNVVLYGLNESPADTPRSDRLKHDIDNILTILSGIDSTLTSASIKDFYSLGKYKQTATRPRPILVKFLRAFEASLVLSKKGSLTSTISIKPDMTQVEREVEQALLKERRNLIDKGIERKFIRIIGNSLYVNRKLHGSVQNSQFHLISSTDNIEHMSVDSDISNSVPLSNSETHINQSANSNSDPPVVLSNAATHSNEEVRQSN